ncbi:MAG: hypothetical protein A2X61_04605 [Ignavibacteria bacterium GWB2_35_12]|nr:MAG: hypothetical protein A2X63_13400 [Ignavibacteria bacterium GWA2_35_8]OGU41911.1 MAG: hypothetical protein A2X61_04605 [Ignavibacteria bacterium GWB2_35_12]OGV24585.1 MAG: hypothetical protein A2475_09195 [Ignavibacteria bacterium RIFOXYC2_FULL_35_21]
MLFESISQTPFESFSECAEVRGKEGQILLNVNLSGLFDDNNIVQFTIHSNAKNSPTGLNMTILPAVKDSLEKKEK